MTLINRVIGYPLTHSQSPLLHHTIYKLLGINATLIPRAHPDVKRLVAEIKNLSVELTAVTMPFKETILIFLDECSMEVSQLKAANTIIQKQGKLYGYNTDVDGIRFALAKWLLPHKNVLIIGAGGAARAAAYVMQQNHMNLFWLNRTKKHVFNLMQQFGGEILTETQVNHMPLDLIIHATPQGMFPQPTVSPLPNFLFKPHQTVLDMVYHPVNTRLLIDAAVQGATIVSGLEMFIGQGLCQIERWTGKSYVDKSLFEQCKKILTNAQISMNQPNE